MVLNYVYWRLTYRLRCGKVGAALSALSPDEKLTPLPNGSLHSSLTSNVDPDKIIELAHRKFAIPLNAEWRTGQ
jgi:hypothetical protein